MKPIYCLAFLLAVASCKQKSEANATKVNTASNENTLSQNDTITKPDSKDLSSLLRPNEKLKLQKIYSDEAEYIEYDGMGDYPFFNVKKNKELVSLATNFEDAPKFGRGDILLLKWKIDTVYIAGESEALNFTEWLVDVKKVKDGNVSLFRKSYKKPIKYYSDKGSYSDDLKDYLYTQVEYYLVNSKNESIKTALKNPESISYSIEEKDKDGQSYYVLGISDDFEKHTNIIQWLYFNNDTRTLYEYDVPNDKLIEFK